VSLEGYVKGLGDLAEWLALGEDGTCPQDVHGNAPAVAYILAMSEPRGRSPMSETMPSLAEVQQDPTILTGLPLPVIVDLRRQISHLAADVDAVLYRTLTEVRTKDQRSDVEPDRLLTPEAAAARFGVTKRCLLDHAEEIGRAAPIPQDRAVQRAPPRAVSGANTGLTAQLSLCFPLQEKPPKGVSG
jgi:hypothetical protein